MPLPRASSAPPAPDGGPFEPDAGAGGSELPLGVEPWTGEDMPTGTASSHGLQAPDALLEEARGWDAARASLAALEPDPGEPAGGAGSAHAADGLAEGAAGPTEGAALNHRQLYEAHFRGLALGEREQLARQASGDELYAWCLDPAPTVVAALLDNPQFGLTHARSLALHHASERGLEILSRRAPLVRDSHVQRRLLTNPLAPDVVLDRVLRYKRLLDVYRASVDRELPERNRVRVRARLRPLFTRAEAEDRAALVIKTEGRCLASLAGCTFDARTTQLLSHHSFCSTLFVQNLARFPATPPVLIAKLLRSPLVQRQPALRALLSRHPNAGSEPKRKS